MNAGQRFFINSLVWAFLMMMMMMAVWNFSSFFTPFCSPSNLTDSILSSGKLENTILQV
jgi:hypothetical protein